MPRRIPEARGLRAAPTRVAEERRRRRKNIGLMREKVLVSGRDLGLLRAMINVLLTKGVNPLDGGCIYITDNSVSIVSCKRAICSITKQNNFVYTETGVEDYSGLREIEISQVTPSRRGKRRRMCIVYKEEEVRMKIGGRRDRAADQGPPSASEREEKSLQETT